MSVIFSFFCNMTLEKLSWITAFTAGLILFLLGIIYLISKKGRRDVHYAWASFWEFMACWIMFIPKEVFSTNSNPIPCLQWIEGILTALIKSFNIYAGNGYERAALAGHAAFSSIYGILRVSANIALTLFVGGFILHFLNGPLQRFKLFWFRNNHLFIFSACNEKTLTIARSIPADKRTGHAQIVFACGDDKVDAAFREEIDALGGLYVASGVAAIAGKYANAVSGIELFLFESSEDRNLIKLEAVCRALGKLKKNREAKIYVELCKAPWDLYDNYIEKHGLENRNVSVNFVRIEETFIYNNLLRNSIFEKAVDIRDAANSLDTGRGALEKLADAEDGAKVLYENSTALEEAANVEDGAKALNHGRETLENDAGFVTVKEIRALIVGEMNTRNTELFKALLHLSQMPGYLLNLTVIESGHSRKKLRQLMPEVDDDGKGVGDSLYHINYLEDIPYESDALEKAIIRACPSFTFVFVNAGEDLLNVHLALQISALAHRRGLSSEDFTLQVSLSNRSICDKWNMNLCGNLMPVGFLEEIYDYQFVTYSDIERGSERIHLARHNTTPWISYLNNEYNRHSVYARTLSYKYKIKLLGEHYRLAGSPAKIEWYSQEDLEKIWAAMPEEEKTWKIYEHMRWNMYTRTLGYRLGSAEALTALLKEDKRLLYDIRAIDAQLAQLDISDPGNKELKNKQDALIKQKKAVVRKIKQIRDTQKIHHALVPFDDLPLEEKIKDNLELPIEVVNVLREI